MQRREPPANPLADSGKPLFFAVDDPAAVGLAAPRPRHAEAVRVCGRSLTVMQKEALVATSRSSTVWRLASDEGAYLAGLDEAPCPLSFFTTGMVSSYLTQLRASAARRNVVIGRVRLVLDNYYTMKGSALRGTMTGGARNPALTVEIEGDAARDDLIELAREATVAAPVNGLLRSALRSRFSLTHGGRPIAAARVAACDESTRADPEAHFVRAVPKRGGGPIPVRRGDKTPRIAHTVTLANDSLAEEQSRLLHVRGICTPRADGLINVEQHLYNPHGSIFHFLCDETAARAPDSASYIAAGIAFCFMTQLGRYAAIARRNLEHTRVDQDLHWSRGDGTHEALAAPIDTHVFVDSAEDDAFACTLLEMAEQTCFLHALCRTALQTDVTVRPFTEGASLPEPRAPTV